MHRIDQSQFNEKNQMLFQKGRWFIFLDFNVGSDDSKYRPRLAHKCNPKNKENYRGTGDWKRYTCCLVILNNEECRDCHAHVPEVFSGFFNLARWSWNA